MKKVFFVLVLFVVAGLATAGAVPREHPAKIEAAADQSFSVEATDIFVIGESTGAYHEFVATSARAIEKPQMPTMPVNKYRWCRSSKLHSQQKRTRQAIISSDDFAYAARQL